MKKVAVIILNWNGRQFLEIFLGMVIERSPEADIWVADNGSSDNSVDFLKKNFPSVNILELKDNYGYTGGYNRALEAIESEYSVLLNSDIEVTEGWLRPLIEIMDNNQNVAAVQPKILSFAQKDHFEYAGASGGFIDILGYPFCRGRFIGQKTECDNGQYNDAREIFWATGAAMMIRRSVFMKMGGLDQNFFAHMEEIDLCWRMKRSGYQIMVEPASYVYHVGGGTLPIWSPRKTYLNFRNNIAMLYKNLSSGKFALIYSIRIITDFLRFLSYLLPLKLKFAKAVAQGHIDFWHMRQKLDRHSELGHNNVSCVYKGSIVLKTIFGRGVFGKMMALMVFMGILSCSGKGDDLNIDLKSPILGSEHIIGEDIHFAFSDNTPFDSVHISVDGKRIDGDVYTSCHVGRTNYLATCYKQGKEYKNSGYFTIVTKRIPAIITPSIVNEFPHSTSSYTQGLLYRNGIMYESAGQYGESSLQITEPETGKVLKRKDLDKKYFAEGLEMIGDTLYQITWQEKTCIKYNASNLEEIGKFKYKGEGWGLATDGKMLYMSNGTSVIKIIDPVDFSVKGNIYVMDQRGEVMFLNELEWINGRIWANIYTKEWIAIINPSTGEVEAYVNCSSLSGKLNKEKTTDVLNGIAFDKETGRIFLTGKNWNKLFQIKF